MHTYMHIYITYKHVYTQPAESVRIAAARAKAASSSHLSHIASSRLISHCAVVNSPLASSSPKVVTRSASSALSLAATTEASLGEREGACVHAMKT